MQPLEIDYSSVNRAFSAQSTHFDADDSANPVLKKWRTRVYKHVDSFLRPGDSILELNAGTGIDAVRFAGMGHSVLATDLSDGMIAQLRRKAAERHPDKLTVRQLSFEHLDSLNGQKFDYVFSNFGGLNCLENLSQVTHCLPGILNPGSRVTFVVMPRVAPWEWLWIFKGKFRSAFRRFSRNGTIAKIDGSAFTAFYHTASTIRHVMGDSFVLLKSESLGIFEPPPSATDFVNRFPGIAFFLSGLDSMVRNGFPFNRWGDHVIQTFEFQP